MPARRSDAYQLRNLTLAQKLLSTLALVAGLGVFLLTWFAAVRLLRWTFSDRVLLLDWGESLCTVADYQPRLYLILVGLSLAGQGLLFLLSRGLFRRSALRHRVRYALSLLGSALLAANVVLWATLPFLGCVCAAAFPVAILTQLVLVLFVAVPFRQMWFYRRFHNPSGESRRVLIVGGGFSGLYGALELDRRVGHARDLELVVIDRNNYFLFPPLLPSAATGAIETRQVTYPFRRIFETTNIRFEKAEVERIDTENRMVHTGVSALPYDVLLLCPGSETNTFRTPGAKQHAFFLRELQDAIALRNRIIDCFEQAAALADPAAQAELLRFVVVGAGPTGIEVATEIHDLIHHVLLKRYPEIDPTLVEISVVQSGKRILPGWNERVVAMAEKQLASLDMGLYLDTRVTAVGPDHVLLASGERLATRNCIWCAGVRPSPLLEHSDLVLDRSGRALTDRDLRARGKADVFVLGDAAHVVDERTGKPLPPLGQVAFQQGPHAARNVIRLLEGRPTRPFRYFNFGALVSVGEHSAAVDLLGLRISGFLGWFVWRTLYLFKLVGMSTKIRVMLDWTLDLLIERSISQIASTPRLAPPPVAQGGARAA